MYSIGVFSTGRGQGSRGLLRALHNAIQSGHIAAEISFVFSNRDHGEFEATDKFFTDIRNYGYPLITSSFRKYRNSLRNDPDWRQKYELHTLDLLQGYKVDLCLLAGFLLWVPEMCQRYMMMNLHPAAPGGPIGLWQEVIWTLISDQASSSGNTMLHVTEELDKGPTATYAAFPIRGPGFDEHWSTIRSRSIEEVKSNDGESNPLFQAIRNAGVIREQPLVVETIKAFSEKRVCVIEGKIVDSRGHPVAGLDLTSEIEALVNPQTHDR
ncbi:phosphoglycerate transporter [Dehalococcoidia bacterium]|nr:phosphoglycerate transporter [Dehalococcoidia bacterium]